jgi:hemerythrin-like domain-containing protein
MLGGLNLVQHAAVEHHLGRDSAVGKPAGRARRADGHVLDRAGQGLAGKGQCRLRDGREAQAMSSNPTATPLDDEQPLDRFANCHKGIVTQLNALGELPTLLGAVSRARQIADDTVQFFQDAVFNHHVDEEKDLFPAVLAHAQAGQERRRIQHLVQQRTAEHRSMERLWAGLQPGLARLATGQSAEVDGAAAEDLVRRHGAHARFEEAEFLPRCAAILGRSSADMAELGLSLHMRHVTPDMQRFGLRGSWRRGRPRGRCPRPQSTRMPPAPGGGLSRSAGRGTPMNTCPAKSSSADQSSGVWACPPAR